MLEIENRRLKKESENVKDEISKCSDLYGRAEQVYIRKCFQINFRQLKILTRNRFRKSCQKE